ncbi:substrate-binding periplasmic protein [Ancylobacter sp. VNQ12]|uniref:substrate-binding periplasmic protein n=1 Tax=Ancylobacter sp. VNQ12 TaxID=3400920 RepID=UPI003C06999E
MSDALRRLAAFPLVLLALTLALFADYPAVAQSDAGGAFPRVLKVGTFAENRPWVFRGEGGDLTGFDVDLVRAVAARLGASIDVTSMPFRELFPALRAGTVDLAICSISVTPERLKTFDFTQPYYETSQGVVVMKGSRFRSLADLAGKSVGTVAGTTNEQWLRENRMRYALGPIVSVEGLEEGLTLLQSRGVDAYFGDLPALLYSLLKRPDLAVVERLTTDDHYAIVLARNSPLTARVDAALAALKADGTLAAIHRRWFGAAPPPGSPVTTVLPRP